MSVQHPSIKFKQKQFGPGTIITVNLHENVKHQSYPQPISTHQFEHNWNMDYNFIIKMYEAYTAFTL